jgi:cell division protein FtsQ
VRRVRRAAALALPALALASALTAGGWLAWRTLVAGDVLRVREVRVTGTDRAAVAEVLELSPARPGDHLLGVDTAAVAAAVSRHPWVARAEVTRRWPPALEIAVVERRPVALIELAGLYLVDANGEPFKRAAPGDGLDLPLVTGIGREDWEERRDEAVPLLAGALGVLSAWSERRLDARKAVSEIHVDAADGATVWTVDGTEVRLGDDRPDARFGPPAPHRLDAKLERLERVLEALAAEGQKATVIHLDDRRHPQRVAVRLAGGGGGGGPDQRSALAR